MAAFTEILLPGRAWRERRHDGAPAPLAKVPRRSYRATAMSGAELEEAPTDWRPGPRPDWVKALHSVADPTWIRLDADELLTEASARTGGLTDFGAADFEEPYRIFVRALDAEAQLH